MSYPHLAEMQRLNRYLVEVLNVFDQRIARIAQQTNANPDGDVLPPPTISRLLVSAANGIFDVQIFDNGPVNAGIHYFLEYSTTVNFSQPVVVHMGTTRNWRRSLGNQTLYFRAYSQYPTSDPSSAVYFGSATNPTAVMGGGSAGPTIQQSTGSGSAKSNGLEGARGFGFKSGGQGPFNPRLGRELT